MLMRFAALIFCTLLAWSSQSFAQTKNFQSLINQFVGADATAKPGAPVAEQLEWIKERLKVSSEQLQQFQNETGSADIVSLAEQIVRNQTFSQTTLEGVIRLEAEFAEFRNKPTPIPPTTRAELLAAKEAVADLRSKLAASASERPLLQQALSEAQASDQTAANAVFALKNAPPEQTRLAQLRAEVSGSALFNLKWREYLEALHSQFNEAQLLQLERSMDLSELDVQLNADRAKEALTQLETEKTKVSAKLAAAQKGSDALSQQLKTLDEKAKAGLVEESVKTQIGILKTSLANANQLAVGLDGNLQLLDLEIKHWNTVKELSATQSLSLFHQTREAIQSDLDWLTKIKAAAIQQFQDTSRLLEQLTARLNPAWRDKSQRALLEKQQQVVDDRVEMLRGVLKRIEEISSSKEKLATEVEARLVSESFQEKAVVSIGMVWATLASVWNYPLPIQGGDFTIGKLILGIFAMIAAFTLASLLSKRAGSVAASRFRTDPTKVVLIEKWVYYFALIAFVLTVLNWLSIPLTVFAFLGGALAIGIGFGGQNLMNNFISGLILLFERRVNVGDIVEVDGHIGKMMYLGSRSSRIRKWDGVDVLVPNSYFLEKNVINWTLSDPNHRYDFIVGVAYGSPVQQCLDLFQTVLTDHPHILKQPEPFVFFENFGDNTLDFHFFYWLPVNVSTINAGRVGSELRTRIDAVCREAKIEIAYPQRDVHLFTGKPIEIKLQSDKPSDSA